MAATALITGASSGIGEALARLHAREGGDLVLVARRADKLESLARALRDEHGIAVTAIADDLGDPEAPARVFAATEAAGLSIDLLINNAGVGGHGKFAERALADERAMVELNIQSLVALTRLYLPGMIARGQGRVLQLASTAAFLPGPLQAVYYASKSFVLSFSQAIAEELRDTGVTVTALCPGPVKTGFVAAAQLDGVAAFDRAKSPESVARIGYDAMLNGKLVAINEPKYAVLLQWVIPLLPRRLVLRLSRQTMEKTG